MPQYEPMRPKAFVVPRGFLFTPVGPFVYPHETFVETSPEITISGAQIPQLDSGETSSNTKSHNAAQGEIT